MSGSHGSVQSRRAIEATRSRSNLDLETTGWNAAVGGHHFADNGVGVKWAGITGTGSVTITLSFTATAL